MVEREGTPRVPSLTLAEAGTRTPEIEEGLESARPVFVAISRTTVGNRMEGVADFVPAAKPG